MNSQKLIEQLSGIFAPVSTPFADNETVDLAALRFNIEHYAQTEIRGYVALGSNGENKSLTEEEKRDVLGTVIRGRGQNQIVIAGAIYEAQRDTERFLKLAADMGADFGLVLSPSYFKRQMTEDVLHRYFATVADTSPVPLLLYNAPGFSGITLSPELVQCLAVHPNIVGMKDSARSGIEAFLRSSGDTFRVMAGSINFLFPAMMAGAIGGTVSLANSFPHIAVELYNCGAAQDGKGGEVLQEKACRINKGISGTYGVPGVKAAMNLAGLRGGIPRRPLLPLNEAQIAELRDFLVKERLL
ncbi:dihydrodipicolinate synthase family protein [Candidatus Poribacteria bacterium]